jgi:hypothetical protein
MLPVIQFEKPLRICGVLVVLAYKLPKVKEMYARSQNVTKGLVGPSRGLLEPWRKCETVWGLAQGA